jgi:hypothetical protein
MKFNWGTGIFIFLALFLMAAAAFIIFAVRQDINLVHRDYYERGTDYTSQMETRARSARFEPLVNISDEKDSLRIVFPEELTGIIDSGNVLFYRPSDSKLDLTFPLKVVQNVFTATKANTVSGRYIIEVQWFTQEKKYEVKKTVILQ